MAGDVDRLHLMKKGREMICVEDCFRMEEKNLTRYIMRSNKTLFGAVSEGMEMEVL